MTTNPFLLKARIIVLFAVIFTPHAKADLADQSNNHWLIAKIGPEELGIIVNDDDPASRKIGEYYKIKRRIPRANMVHIRFKPGNSTMNHVDFQNIKADVDAMTPRNVQAYALTWTVPFRVECMSITTAFAAGFDEGFCSKKCAPTKLSPYFNSISRRPFDDYRLRPTMMLAGKNFNEVKKLIDRGVVSDRSFPKGTGYLVSTSDKARNVRAVLYPDLIAQYFDSPLDLRLVKDDFIKNKTNVLFYFTGVTHVKALNTIKFVPGAIADHLTSVGGDLSGKGVQMSSLRWLEAGATGSYGTVIEPCNYLAKFPHPGVVINHYLHGETLLEAYWKSVAMPGEGVFIGDPLAAPFSMDVSLDSRQR